MSIHWIPLESNPQVLNDFATGVGLGDGFSFHDVWGLEPELLGFVPKPCYAVMLLYPITEPGIQEKHREERALLESGKQKTSETLFFMKQEVGNACGTIAVLHALANNRHVDGLLKEGFVTKFLADGEKATPEERGHDLGEARDVQSASDQAAATGSTSTPEATADTGHHFICFVEHDGHVYEMDGGKPCPVHHGAIPAASTLLDHVALVVKEKFVAHAPENPNFSLLALVKTPSEEGAEGVEGEGNAEAAGDQ